MCPTILRFWRVVVGEASLLDRICIVLVCIYVLRVINARLRLSFTKTHTYHVQNAAATEGRHEAKWTGGQPASHSSTSSIIITKHRTRARPPHHALLLPQHPPTTTKRSRFIAPVPLPPAPPGLPPVPPLLLLRGRRCLRVDGPPRRLRSD